MTTDERIENLEKGLAIARCSNRWLLAAFGLALGTWLLVGTLRPTTAAAPDSAAAASLPQGLPRYQIALSEGRRPCVIDAYTGDIYMVAGAKEAQRWKEEPRETVWYKSLAGPPR